MVAHLPGMNPFLTWRHQEMKIVLFLFTLYSNEWLFWIFLEFVCALCWFLLCSCLLDKRTLLIHGYSFLWYCLCPQLSNFFFFYKINRLRSWHLSLEDILMSLWKRLNSILHSSNNFLKEWQQHSCMHDSINSVTHAKYKHNLTYPIYPSVNGNSSFCKGHFQLLSHKVLSRPTVMKDAAFHSVGVAFIPDPNL